MSVAVGAGIFLLGLGLLVKGLNLNSKYAILLCVLGAFLVGKGATMLGVF